MEEFRTNLKRRIEDSSQTVKRVYREQLISLYTTSPQITSMFHEIKNSLHKTRNTSYSVAPCTIDDVNIEGIWSKTLNGEQFILNNSKHPIFGTLQSLKKLSKSDNDHLFFEGTFKSCSNPFYQLYSVYSVNSELSTHFIT